MEGTKDAWQHHELDDVQRLQHVATQLIDSRGIDALYEQILDTAQAILHSDFASFQIFYPERGSGGELWLFAHRGFTPEAARRWEWIAQSSNSVCAEALRTGHRVVVPDFQNCDFITDSDALRAFHDVGIRSAQATPLVSRSGCLLGMVSTHWRNPRELTASEVRSLDVLARLAADLIERARVEDALRRSEERLRHVAESAGKFIWEVDVNGVYLYASPAVEHILGYAPEELVGKVHFSILFAPEGSEATKAAASEIFARRDVFRAFLGWTVRKDGSIVALETSGQPILDRNGNFLGYRGEARDVTERKRVEDALERSEERYRLAVRATNDAIWDMDLANGAVHWNETYATLYGKPVETSNSWQWWIDHIHPEDRDRAVRGIRSAISGAESIWTCEYRFRRIDGVWAYIYSRAYIARAPSGRAWRVVGAMQDLTERKQAELALRENEQRLTRAEFLANVGHWSADLVTDRLAWSKGMFRIFGQPEEFVPTFEGWLAAVLPHDVDRVRQWCADCIGEKRADPLEFQITRSDGEVRTLAVTAEIIVGDDDSPVRLFGTTQDISDSRRAQQEMLASQKLESIGTLASGIAHDFNNLLGGVLALAELALAEVAAGTEPAEELNGICTLAIRGAEIVRELMVYAGEETAVVTLVDLSQTVSQMVALLKVSISKHAVLETDLDNNLPPIRGSAAQLQQVVMNLVTNASEAIGEGGGKIRVVTRSIRRNTIGSEDLHERDYLQLEVSDSGGGMSPETQARIFDPFFTTKSAGHGLGLAVVYGIVRGLDGSIDVRSERGRGSSFTVTLPCAHVDEMLTEPVVSESGDVTPEHHDASVLVVEDEESLRQVLVKQLQTRGYEVIEAADGSAAIDILHSSDRRIDLLLLDLTIPGQPSHDVVREVERTRPGCKVLLMSAYSEEFVTTTLTGPKIEGFIRKPFKLDALLHSIGIALSS